MLSTAAPLPRLQSLFLSLRTAQWTKNLIIFAGLLFGGRELQLAGGDLTRAAASSIAAFVIFCLLSGAVYLINDIRDRETDQRHPIKAMRPIASGVLPVPLAAGAALVAGLEIERRLLDVLDDVFLLDLPLEAAKRAFDRLAFLDFDFGQSN